MSTEDPPKFARGGFIEPGDGDDYTRPGCGIRGYCPTHDGRVYAARNGKVVDATEEFIAASLNRIDIEGETRG